MIKFMKRISLNQVVAAVAVFALPLITLAQEHAEETGVHEGAHESGLPTVVYLQAINFLLYVGLIVYYARKPIREFFSGRVEKFNSAITKAAQAKEEAEAQKKSVMQKIEEFSRTHHTELARAKAEAADLQARMLKDAEEISAHLKTEASRTATYEIERAKNELRESLLQQSVAFSSKLLKEKIAEPDLKRLQTEFVDKIGASR